MTKVVVFAVMVVTLGLAPLVRGEDKLEELKTKMSGAQCYEVKFLSIVNSDVFNTVDTTEGEAYIALDGRYSLEIGSDHYVYDREFLYSYSREQNQVTIEPFDYRDAPVEEVTFIVKLDKYYKTKTVKKDREYQLTRIDTSKADLPDSLTLFLKKGKAEIESLEFYDLNQDLNRIVFKSQKTKKDCDEGKLYFDIPDNANIVRMYQQ